MSPKNTISREEILRCLGSTLKNKLGVPTPIWAHWEITYRCNMRCKFCNIWRQTKKYYKNEVTLHDAKTLIREMADLGVCHVYFTGGEPLLRKDLPKIMKACKKNSISVSMNTNGFFLRENYDKIEEYVNHIFISLDSPFEKEHDEIRRTDNAYSKALAAIRYVKNRGGKLMVNMVVTKENINDMERMIELCKSYGVAIQFLPAASIPAEGGKNIEIKNLFAPETQYATRVRDMHKKYSKLWYYEPYLQLIENGGIHKNNFACFSSRNALNLKPDGSIVFPCYPYPKSRYRIDGSSLKEIWNRHQGKSTGGYCDFCEGCTLSCYLLPSLINKISNISYIPQVFSSSLKEITGWL